uniref:Copia protein n=1 Tax=Davidia involucrata TaxID=16924 RepID=A0A5B6ZAR0_DAVIN
MLLVSLIGKPSVVFFVILREHLVESYCISRHHPHQLLVFFGADWTGNRSNRRSTSGYCTFVGDNLVTWRNKKQNVVARSSVEAEYRAMAHTACELLWVRSLLHDMEINVPIPMPMYCDNQAAIFIASNPVFHERTKHIEVDCHFIRDLVLQKQIVTPYVQSGDQLGDIFTKPMARATFLSLCSKLGIFNLYAPACGRVLEFYF